MAANARKAELAWSDSARQHEKRIGQLNEQNRELLAGTDTEPGIRQLQVDLHKLLVDRRRVWPGCDPTSRKRGKGTAKITVTINQTDAKDQPNHGIAKGTVLYAFEELSLKNKGEVLGDFDVGQYLGEFAVTNTNGKLVHLVPTCKLNTREVHRLVEAKRPWVLYELLPRDSHEIFASLSDEQKKALLPVESLKDYLKDGKPAEKDDPPECVVNGKYVRPLFDYGIMFNDEYEKRMLLADTIVALQQDKQLVYGRLGRGPNASRPLRKDIAATKRKGKKRSTIATSWRPISKNLEKNLGDMEAWIARLTELNQAMAGRIAKLQLEAAQRIDRRTREMAQSGAGRL